jgi:hypothetical protein
MRRVVPPLLALAALLAAPLPDVSGAEPPPGMDQAGPERPMPEFRFLPRLQIEGEVGLMAENRPEHTLRTQRRMHVRIVEWGSWFVDSVFEEELLWGLAPDQVDHTFDYFRAGRRFGPVSAFLFWNHTCNNPVWARGINRIRWNDVGVEVTNNPDPGGGRMIPLLLRARAAFAAMLYANEYRWTAQASARWQPWPGRTSPYAEIVLDAVGDPDRTTLCPTVEIGATFPLGNGLSAEPFVRVHRRRDAMGYGEDTDTWFLAGMRLLQRVGPGGEDAGEGAGGIHLELRGGYAARIPQDVFGYVSNVSLRIVAPGFLGDRAFFEVHAGINSPPEDMVPIFETLSVGPSLEGTAGPCSVRASYRYRERWAVRLPTEDDPYRCCHAFRLEVSREGWMAEGLGTAATPRRFRWEASAAVFPFAVEFPYIVEAGGSVRVYLFPAGVARFFFTAETRHFAGLDRRSLLGGAAEVSVVLPGLVGDARIFLRFERAADPFRNGKKQHAFLGFDLSF